MIAILMFFPRAATADEQGDRDAVRALVEGCYKNLAAHDLNAFMAAFSDDFLSKGVDKLRVGKEMSFAIEHCPVMKFDCAVSDVSFSGDAADVKLSGSRTMQCGKDPLETKSCDEDFRGLSGGAVRREDGGWKIYGDQDKGYRLSAMLVMDSPGAAFLNVRIGDMSSLIKGASVSGDGIARPAALTEGIAADTWQSLELPAPYRLNLAGMKFPLKYSVAVDDGRGGATLATEITDIMKEFPRPVSPAATKNVAARSVVFKWRPIESPLFSGEYRLEIYDKSGAVIDSVTTGKTSTAYEAKKLSANTTYFYRISAADRYGNILRSRYESFRYNDKSKGAYQKYGFTAPDEIYSYTNRPSVWVSGVYFSGDYAVVNETRAATLDILYRKPLALKASYSYRFGIRGFCVLPGRIFAFDQTAGKINMISFDGKLLGGIDFPGGGADTVLACDAVGRTVYANDSNTGELKVFNSEGKPVKAVKIPAGKIISFDAGGGRVYVYDSAGRLAAYVLDGGKKPLAEYKIPAGVSAGEILVYSEKGKLVDIIDKKIGAAPASAAAPAAVSVVSRNGKVYAMFMPEGACNICGRMFDVDEKGKIILNTMFR